MVAMAMPPGRGDQCREMVDQLQWREGHRRGAIALWFAQSVDNALVVEQLQMLERERREGTIAMQPFQDRAVANGNALRGIQ